MSKVTEEELYNHMVNVHSTLQEAFNKHGVPPHLLSDILGMLLAGSVATDIEVQKLRNGPARDYTNNAIFMLRGRINAACKENKGE